MTGETREIFRRGSTTFFNSSLFFPPDIRRDVTALYAFVRVADDYVDAVPQQREEFLAYRQAFSDACANRLPPHPVIDPFVELMRRCAFDPAWVEAFLDAMEQDLHKRDYLTLDETLHYIHGSAEVVGMMMARIMRLPHEALPSAAMLGRAFQYVNFVRDLQEDLLLGRRYLPRDEMDSAGLTDLTESSARAQPEAFSSFIRSQLQHYAGWQNEGEAGFRYIPRRLRIAIQTASRMYGYTAKKIEKDPFVVFRGKVKPSRARIIGAALVSLLSGAKTR